MARRHCWAGVPTKLGASGRAVGGRRNRCFCRSERCWRGWRPGTISRTCVDTGPGLPPVVRDFRPVIVSCWHTMSQKSSPLNQRRSVSSLLAPDSLIKRLGGESQGLLSTFEISSGSSPRSMPWGTTFWPGGNVILLPSSEMSNWSASNETKFEMRATSAHAST